MHGAGGGGLGQRGHQLVHPPCHPPQDLGAAERVIERGLVLHGKVSEGLSAARVTRAGSEFRARPRARK